MGILRVLSRAGDDETRWEPASAASVAQAEAVFKAMRAQRYAAYIPQVGGGEKAPIIRDFDPGAHEIIMFEGVVGG